MQHNSCSCRSAASSAAGDAFDARAAYKHLAAKYQQLAELVIQQLSLEGADPTHRATATSNLVDDLVRIVGGVPIPANEFPECCLIGRASAASLSWFCTGVVVHPRIVLTAAHCHNPSAPANRIAVQTANFNSVASANTVKVKRMVVSPGYQGRENDIAVLVLSKDAPVTPVAMATAAEIGTANSTTLAGFGNSDIHSTVGFGTKRKVTVPITHLRRLPTDDFDDAEAALDFESDLEFCAGGSGFDSCNGDSGGPAYIRVGSQFKVAGLTSRAFADATNPCGEGGVYTRVDQQLAFIGQVAANHGINL